jgi:hypothetical protein
MEELKPGFYRIFGEELVPPANEDDLSMELHRNRSVALQLPWLLLMLTIPISVVYELYLENFGGKSQPGIGT